MTLLPSVAGAGSSPITFSATLPVSAASSADATTYGTAVIHWSPWTSGLYYMLSTQLHTPHPSPSAAWCHCPLCRIRGPGETAILWAVAAAMTEAWNLLCRQIPRCTDTRTVKQCLCTLRNHRSQCNSESLPDVYHIRYRDWKGYGQWKK